MRIRKKYETRMLAEKYYGLISLLNDLSLNKEHLEFLAHLSITGSRSPSTIEEKKALLETTGIGETAMNTIVRVLRKKGIMVKAGKNTLIQPFLLINPLKSLTIELILENGEATNDIS